MRVRNDYVNFYVSAWMFARIEERAKKAGLSPAEWAREILLRHLEAEVE